MLGVTVNFTNNEAGGGIGGSGAHGAVGQGGKGADGTGGVPGGEGGYAQGGDGGNGGSGGSGFGGAIANQPTGTLTIAPRFGAKKGSNQSKAVNLITANQAFSAPEEAVVPRAMPFQAQAAALTAPPARSFPSKPGTPGATGAGIGGGLYLVAGGKAVIDNTNTTGNHASTSDNDVFGMFSE